MQLKCYQNIFSANMIYYISYNGCWPLALLIRGKTHIFPIRPLWDKSNHLLMFILSPTKLWVLTLCVNPSAAELFPGQLQCIHYPGNPSYTGNGFTAEDKGHLIHGFSQWLSGKPMGQITITPIMSLIHSLNARPQHKERDVDEWRAVPICQSSSQGSRFCPWLSLSRLSEFLSLSIIEYPLKLLLHSNTSKQQLWEVERMACTPWSKFECWHVTSRGQFTQMNMWMCV